MSSAKKWLFSPFCRWRWWSSTNKGVTSNSWLGFKPRSYDWIHHSPTLGQRLLQDSSSSRPLNRRWVTQWCLICSSAPGSSWEYRKRCQVVKAIEAKNISKTLQGNFWKELTLPIHPSSLKPTPTTFSSHHPPKLFVKVFSNLHVTKSNGQISLLSCPPWPSQQHLTYLATRFLLGINFFNCF